MKILIQRVTCASVAIDGKVKGEIGRGYMALVGCRTGDTAADAGYLAERMVNLRIFEDDSGKMNKSLADIGGSALLISQFTLYADTRKGNRPGFSLGGNPADAEKLYGEFIARVSALITPERVATGCFGADMKVSLVNDGPVTIELCSDAKFPKEQRA